MEIKIEKKASFTIAGIKEPASSSTNFPKIWDSLFEKVGWQDLENLGDGTSYGACLEMKPNGAFSYMAGYDVTDIKRAEALGLEIQTVPAAEYAIVKLVGPVPDCIHQGWQYIMKSFFPETGFQHAGTPDFEVYSEGDMSSPDYQMELWVPIRRE